MHGLGEPLYSLALKTERAKKHVLELESEYERFRKDHAYVIGLKTDPNTGDGIFYLESAKPIPPYFSPIIGDAANNLRSCLDYVAYALVEAGQPSAVKRGDRNFPIGGSASGYTTRLKRIIRGLRPDAIRAINKIEPYKGGKGEYFWHLAQLNNFDKHRLLLTVWGSLEAHTMLPSQRGELGRFHRKDPSEFRGSFHALTNRAYPLEVGDLLLTVPKMEMEENMQFLLSIAFAEPEIVKGNPVIETLHEMTNMVRKLVFDFDKLGLFR